MTVLWEALGKLLFQDPVERVRIAPSHPCDNLGALLLQVLVLTFWS